MLFPDRLSSRGWSYWLVYPPERRMVPKIKRFREWLLAEVAKARAMGTEKVEAAAAE
jgi:LysR family glycine cleavage system transcriptional activator